MNFNRIIELDSEEDDARSSDASETMSVDSAISSDNESNFVPPIHIDIDDYYSYEDDNSLDYDEKSLNEMLNKMEMLINGCQIDFEGLELAYGVANSSNNRFLSYAQRRAMVNSTGIKLSLSKKLLVIRDEFLNNYENIATEKGWGTTIDRIRGLITRTNNLRTRLFWLRLETHTSGLISMKVRPLGQL